MKKSVCVVALLTALVIALPAQSAADFQTKRVDGGLAITGYTGAAKDVVIPAEIDGAKVLEIGANAFISKGLTSVTIPNGVSSIGVSAFYLDHLTSVTIPDSVISIERQAFYGNKLTSVTIPDSVSSIGARAFYLNFLTSVTIPNSVSSIGDGAFAGDILFDMIIGNRVTTIKTIGTNVNMHDDAFDNAFAAFYADNGKKAGVYTFADGKWSYQAQ